MTKTTREVTKFFLDNNFSWRGENGSGLSIDGVDVGEFNPYWHHISGGAVSTYLDVAEISKNFDQINKTIRSEMQKDVSFEEERLGVSRATAVANLAKLSNIAAKLDAYCRLCSSIGLVDGDPRLPISPT